MHLPTAKYPSKRTGAVTLPVVLIIASVIMELAVAGILISSAFTNIALNTKLNTESYAAAVAGAQDGILRVIKYCPLEATGEIRDGATRCPSRGGDPSCPAASYCLAIGEHSVSVSLIDELYDNGAPTGNKLVVAETKITNRNKRIEAYLEADKVTGKITIRYFKECFNDETAEACNFSGATNIPAPPGSSPLGPGVPVNLAAIGGNDLVSLEWDAPLVGSPPTSYRVYRGLASGSGSLITVGGCANLGNVTSCTDDDPVLSNGTAYYYRVRAANAAGESGYSNEVSATPQQPTRFYLLGDSAATITPDFDGGWERFSAADRKRMSATPTGTATVEKTVTDGIVNTDDTLVRQYISDPIAAQEISGSIKGYIFPKFSLAGAQGLAAVVVKVVSGDGTTVRGVLDSYFPGLPTDGTLFATDNQYQSRRIACCLPRTLAPVQALAGDRIVIEIGYREFTNLAHTARFIFHDHGAADIPETETEADTNKNPWIEFSDQINFQ